MSGWIGVDLDGTLSQWDGKWRGAHYIGEPIEPMVERVKQWLKEGKKVKIFTARAERADAIPHIEKWCEKHIGVALPVTNVKDMQMWELWDDRAVTVERNTGKVLTIKPIGK